MLINDVVEVIIINNAIKLTTTPAMQMQTAMNRNHINGIKAEVVANIHSEQSNHRNGDAATQMLKAAMHLLQARK